LESVSIHYDEPSIKKSKQSFLTSGCVAKEEIKPEVAQSWKRCKDLKLHHTSAIQIPLNLYSGISKEFLYLRDSVLPEIVDCLYKTLDMFNGALFYAYDNGVVFSQRGNKEMLQYLNSLNIGIGTCLKEEYLGTTGLAFILDINTSNWAIGEEHYLDLLTPYATYCYYSDDLIGKSFTFIILPKENFTDYFLSYIKISLIARKVATASYRKELELDMKTKLFNQFIEYNSKAVLFVDNFGKIVSANKLFTDWFNLNSENIINSDCAKIFPEFNKALDSLKTGKKIQFEEIYLEKAPPFMQYMRMDVSPTLKNTEITGLTISLSDSKSVRRTVNKISNSQAYYTFDDIIGDSMVMKNVKQKALNVAQSNSTVIITGESGTGKELFAQAIHNSSQKKEGPFVALNCAALPPELIASELFGYVEGAFTGARKGGSMGKFEYAHKGTLFLDEIGELPMYAQTILLRVLEERSVTRIGSNTATPINVRLICATNRNLKKMLQEGTFRSDLFYRINVINLHLPALKERISDIPLLVNHYIKYFNTSLNKEVKGAAPEALSYLINYPWSGNLRELRNTLECGMNNAIGQILKLEHLPKDNMEDDYDEANDFFGHAFSLDDEFIKKDKQKILYLMVKLNGNKSLVAQYLGLSRSTLYRKLKDYELDQ